MRFFSIFPVLIAFACASPFTNPGEVTLDTHDNFYNAVIKSQNSRIATGFAAKTGEFPELCYLSIYFYQKQQNCGCWLYDELHVITSATCVRECSEGTASNITVTFPSLSGKDAVKKIAKIFVPTATNGAAALADGFVPDVDFKLIPKNNQAAIRLDSKFVFDGKIAVNKAKITEVADYMAWQLAKPVKDYRYRICGLGVVDNQGTRPKGVTCTEVNIVDKDKCVEQYDPTKSFAPADDSGQLCLQWDDRDNNACIGDFGGPVYAYKLDAKLNIDVTSQEVFCTVVGSPNVRKAAPCLDGHILWCQHLFGPTIKDSKNAITWIKNVILEP